MKFSLIILYFILISCTSQPEPIYFGQDGCTHCLMTISDQRFASIIWTDKSKTYKFDSIECAAAYYQKNNLSPTDFREIKIPDFFKPETYIPHDQAIFIVDSIFKSPMSLNLAATSKLDERAFFETYKWEEIVIYVDNKWKK